MEINGKTVPFTATHYNKTNGEFIRIGKGEYAQCLLDGKYWVECSVLRNKDLPRDLISSSKSIYGRIFKTGISADICNIRLMWIGSNYRI